MNRTSVVVGVLISVALSVGIATGSLVLGSDEGRWLYLYVRPFEFRLVVPPILASLAAIGLLRVRVPEDRREWMLVFAWILVATGLHVVLRSDASYTLESLFVSDSANGFYGTSKQFEPSDLLERFNRVRLQSPLHAQANMPGKVLLVYGLRLMTERTDVLPWLVVLVSNLGAALMYLFVRDLLADRRAALLSAVLYLFTPARIFFFPIMNTVTPVVVLGAACVLLRWLRSGNASWAAFLGMAVYVVMFFEPLPLSMGLVGVGLTIAHIVRGGMSWERAVLHSLLAIVVFVATSEVVDLATGFEIVRAFRQIGEHATSFNVEVGRPYWYWVRWNLLEFLAGVGGCQAVMIVGALASTRFRGACPERAKRVEGDGWREWLTRPLTVLCLGLLATLAALDLIGINRGEVIRLWIFLACFFQIPAACLCATLKSRTAIGLVLWLTIVEAALGTALIGFVVP